MRSTRALIIALALTVAVAGPVAAQDPAQGSSRPERLFGAIGVGLSTVKVNYEGAEDTPHHEAAGVSASFGWRLTPSVLMGVGVSADSETQDGRRATTTGVEGFVRWYPGTSPVFLRFGFGMAGARIRITTAGAEDLTVRRGVGLNFGIGYDVRLMRHLSLTPEAYWRMLAVGDVPVQGVNHRNVSLNNWFVGAGLTFH
jgi:hypothetical protein